MFTHFYINLIVTALITWNIRTWHNDGTITVLGLDSEVSQTFNWGLQFLSGCNTYTHINLKYILELIIDTVHVRSRGRPLGPSYYSHIPEVSAPWPPAITMRL